MRGTVKQWWEDTAGDFQAAADLDVGVRWTMAYEAGFESDLNLLGEVAGTDVLELGCGGGQCSVALAERGARVTGVDLTREQLRFARDLAVERGVDVALVEGDVTALPIASESQDVAFNAYVFQWVDDLAAACAEAERVLRPGGRFAFSMPHPAYELADPESHEITDSYFDTGWRVTPDPDAAADMALHRHTVSGVYDAVRSAGFDVRRLLEPGTDDPEDYEAGPWGGVVPELTSKLPETLIVVADKPE